MRGNVPGYELRRPRDLSEALRTLKAEPGVWRPFAGGTDLMVVLETGKLAHRRYLSLWHLDELRGIEETASHVTLGALTTFTQVRAHAILQREFPMLCAAAAETGAVAIQNRGTLGGNIANASPAADSPPALLAYEAELELVSADGTRWVPYGGFHTGYKKMALRTDELVRRIRLPRRADGWIHHYRKVGTRKAQAISKVCFAGLLGLGEGRVVKEARIALGAVAPTPVRCPHTEAFLAGRSLDAATIAQACDAIRREISPIDDIRSNAAFRSKVTVNLLEEFLSKV